MENLKSLQSCNTELQMKNNNLLERNMTSNNRKQARSYLSSSHANDQLFVPTLKKKIAIFNIMGSLNLIKYKPRNYS